MEAKNPFKIREKDRENPFIFPFYKNNQEMLFTVLNELKNDLKSHKSCSLQKLKKCRCVSADRDFKCGTDAAKSIPSNDSINNNNNFPLLSRSVHKNVVMFLADGSNEGMLQTHKKLNH